MTGPARGADGDLEPAPAELVHASPQLLRVVLGARLRQLREGQQIDRKRAADTIRGSDSKISRLENGHIGCKSRDVADLLTLYGVTDEPERETLLALVRRASQPLWWQDYRDVVPGWFETYLSLEQDAQVIRVYEPCHIPGLLQTADYARAVICHGYPDAPADEIDRRVSLRMHRQHVAGARPTGPAQIWAVLGEAALRRPAGSAATMRAQLRHLVSMAERPHTRIFVVPFSAGQVGAVGSPVSILRFPGQLIPDVAYIEYLTQATYPETPAEICHYWHLMNTLATHALSADDTMTFVRQILGDA